MINNEVRNIRREQKTHIRTKQLVSFFGLVGAYLLFFLAQAMAAQEGNTIRYVPIGDSYTIGTGASPEESWPALLTNHLQKQGFDIQLIANPAHNGWTAAHAIQLELPVLQPVRANFVTVMIGVNDWVQGVDAATFRRNFVVLLDTIQSGLKNKTQLLVVNIPDFFCTPSGRRFAGGRNIEQGITEFNEIIADESHKRKLIVVDIYTVSQKMRKDPSLTARDGLHPSAKGYLLFEEAIYSEAKKLLKK